MPNERLTRFTRDVLSRASAYNADPSLFTADVARFNRVEGRRFAGDYTLAHPLIRPFAEAVARYDIRLIDMPTALSYGASVSDAAYGASSPDGTMIAMRDFDQYQSPEAYAHILAHELIHSMGRRIDEGSLIPLYGVLSWIKRAEEATAEVGAFLAFDRLGLPMSEQWYDFSVGYVAHVLVGGYDDLLPLATGAAENRLALLLDGKAVVVAKRRRRRPAAAAA